jgi:hypothetical protein
MRSWLVAVGLCMATAVQAQERTVTARVVEIAGADLYLDAGGDAGLAEGDTLVVRRAADTAPVGAFIVVAVSSARAVVSFAGAPFAVTRGDALVLTLHGATEVTAAPAPAVAPPVAGPSRSHAGVQLHGSAAIDVQGSHNTTIGFGANPELLIQDYAVPATRLRVVLSNLPGGGRFITSLRASQQVGSASLFDRGTVMRVYDAHYERDAGLARIEVGRFFSPYEPFSGIWDGALLRLGGAQGFGLGVAGGYQPELGDEGFSTTVPKFAAFADFRQDRGPVRLDADLSAHIWRPTDGTPDRTFLGWSQHLRVGGVRLDHLVEVDQSTTGSWNLTRLDVRTGIPMGSRFQVSAEYYRDRLWWWSSTPDSLLPTQDRVTTGASYQFGAGFISADATLLLSGTTVQGHTYSGSLQLPEIASRVSLGGAVSYWTLGTITGLVATPTLRWRLGLLRPSLTYEFFRSTTPNTTSISHGGILGFVIPWTRGLESSLRFTARYGQNVHSFGMYSSLRLFF